MLARLIREELETKQVIPREHQFSLRSGHSCELQTLRMVEEISCEFELKEQISMAY